MVQEQLDNHRQKNKNNLDLNLTPLQKLTQSES